MNLLEHFNTFVAYPGATVSHWAIGLLAGMLLVAAHHPKEIILSLLMLGSFYLYEVVEFLRIKDMGDVDIANGTFAFFLGIGIAMLINLMLNRFLAKPTNRAIVEKHLISKETHAFWQRIDESLEKARNIGKTPKEKEESK